MITGGLTAWPTSTQILFDTCGLTNGSQPLFDMSAKIASTAWTATSGGGYQTTGTIDTVTHGNPSVNLFENGQYMLRATSLSNMQATPGTYWVSSDTVANPTIYVNSTLGNPATSGATYYYSAHVAPDMTACTGCTINNIAFRRGLDDIGDLGLGYSSHGTNLTLSQGGRHDLYMYGGSLVDYSTATDEYYSAGTGGSIFFVCYDNTASPQSCTFNQDTATQTTAANAIYNQNTGYYSHAGMGTRPLLTVSNSTATNVLVGIGGTQLTALNVTNDTINMGSISSAQGVGVQVTTTISGLTITGSGSSQDGIAIPNSVGPQTITISGPSGATDYLSGANIVLTGSVSAGLYTFASGTGSTISEKNVTMNVTSSDNMLNGTGGYTLTGNYESLLSATAYVWNIAGTGSTLTANYNLFAPTLYGWSYNGTVYSTLAAWQTASSQDSNSAAYNPAYVQPSAGGLGTNASGFSGIAQWSSGVASASYTLSHAPTSGGGSIAGYTVSGAPATGSGNQPVWLIGSTASTGLSYNINGTMFAINAPSGFTGNLDQKGINGSTVYTLDYLGDLTLSGALAGTYLKTTSTSSCSVYLYNGATEQACVSAATQGTVKFGKSNLTSDATLGFGAWLTGLFYSAAGTALPTCQSVTNGEVAWVSDASSSALNSTYTSGGSTYAQMACTYNGSSYAWKLTTAYAVTVPTTSITGLAGQAATITALTGLTTGGGSASCWSSVTCTSQSGVISVTTGNASAPASGVNIVTVSWGTALSSNAVAMFALDLNSNYIPVQAQGLMSTTAFTVNTATNTLSVNTTYLFPYNSDTR